MADSMSLAKALAAIDSGDVAAAQTMQRNSDALTAKIITWKLLQQQNVNVDFGSYANFIKTSLGWPRLDTIRVRAENHLPADLDDVAVLAWFNNNPPQTSQGLVRFVTAAQNSSNDGIAHATLHEFFQTKNFGNDGLRMMQTTLGDQLGADDYTARADKLIWDEKYADAEQLVPYTGNQRPVFAARLALLQNKTTAQQMLDALPDEMQNDPGIAYARAHWRRVLGFDNSAAVILTRVRQAAGHEEDIAKERAVLARRFFERSDFDNAYAVSASQPVVAGPNATQNIWFAGWLALRHLDNPSDAVMHFTNFYQNVKTPMSQARGAYWLARANYAAGNKSDATQWFQTAAKQATTFYGQLAARTLGQDLKTAIGSEATVTAADDKAFASEEPVRAAQLLFAANRTADAQLFYRRLLQDADSAERFQTIAQHGLKISQPQIAVIAAKEAQQVGIALPVSGFPLLPTVWRNHIDARLDPALAHSLIRQESQFDYTAMSKAGAMGLMQVMPGTAKMVADKLGLNYNRVSAINDPAQNVQLGSTYFADRLEQFDGSLALAIASYNAGAGNVKKWTAQFGDPRQPSVDWIDWTESIPFYETRNYVQRVMENMEVYRVKIANN